MNLSRPVFLTLFIFVTSLAYAQTDKYIGTTEEFILENVKGYEYVEERGIEHEEFNVLVFEEKGRELSFYFTFYKGAKVCNYIKSVASVAELREELNYIKATFRNTAPNIWENNSKTVQVQIDERDGRGIILMKKLHNL